MTLSPSMKVFVEKIVVPEEPSSEQKRYPVIPEGKCVIGFQLQGSLALEKEKRLIPLSPAGVTGIQTEVRYYHSIPGTRTVLIYFTPWGARAAFKESFSQFANQSISLKELMKYSELEILQEKMMDFRGNPSQIVQVLNAWLLERCGEYIPDMRLMHVVKKIHARQGSVSISEIVEEVCLSPRQLERLFLENIGISPKKYADLIRFSALLKSMKKEIQPQWAAFATQYGFYDQSHLIKAFHQYTQMTPEEFCRIFTIG